MTATKTAKSSKEAITRNGSPRANAHGAFCLESLTANQDALPGQPPLEAQPPIATSFPSAFASTLNLAEVHMPGRTVGEGGGLEFSREDLEHQPRHQRKREASPGRAGRDPCVEGA